MLNASWRQMLVGLATALVTAVSASAASAAITPTLTLDQSAGTTAAGTANLGLNVSFAPTADDTVKDLTFELPSGLLPDATIFGGYCITETIPILPCQIATGTVSATSPGFNVSATLPITFDLVAPPRSGDLAGLQLLSYGLPLGPPADVTVRPPGDPDGVGLTVSFGDLPSYYPVFFLVPIQISVTAIQTTFAGLRYPSSCPAKPANVTVSADSEADATIRTASAPLAVSGCSTAAYAPALTVTATKDSGDSGVQITTDIIQTAAQATTGTTQLTFPSAVLTPNVAAVVGGGLLCSNPASGTCTTIGTASATSPLYPTPLTGQAYLTGTLTAPGITIAFPPPFAITLTGQVSLATNTTTFTGMPDIPLTNLQIVLAGGANAAFAASCSPSSGTASAAFTSQNGDQTVPASSTFTVSGCPVSPAVTTTTTTTATPTTTTTPLVTPTVTPRAPGLSSVAISGLAGGSPKLSFKLTAGKNAAGLRSFAIKPPAGLSFVSRRVHGRRTVTGVSLTGAKIKSISISRGLLVITLTAPVSSLKATVRASAVKESRDTITRARERKIKRLKLTVIVRDGPPQSYTLTKSIHL
ncbi:MAG: hypothetical protein ACLPZR_26640 [Solirubrobacteraceae bacterium]